MGDLEQFEQFLGEYIGGSNGMRYFKVTNVDGKKIKDNDEGRYKITQKSSPGGAARKAFSQLTKKYNTNKIVFVIKETTQGSNKKEYGPYEGIRVRLTTPKKVMYKGSKKPVLIKHEDKIRLIKEVKQKGGGGMTSRELVAAGVVAGAGALAATRACTGNNCSMANINVESNLGANNVPIPNNDFNNDFNNLRNASPFIPGLNNLEDESLEKELLSKLNLRSLMKSRTSRQRKQTVNAMLRNKNNLREVFIKTAENDREYIKRLYIKSLFEPIPFLLNSQNNDRFLRVMKEVMDEYGIIPPEPAIRWMEWCAGRPFPELSYMIGGVGGGRNCSNDGGGGRGGGGGHIFTFYNLQIDNMYYYEGGNQEGTRILRRDNIQLTDINYYVNEEQFTIVVYFEHRLISFYYHLPRSFMVLEYGKKPGWSVSITAFPSHISVFKPL